MAVATLPLQSYPGWKVSISILHVVAISSAVYRLVHRFRIRRTWWDDYMVFVPLVLDIAYWATFFVRFPHRIEGGRPAGDGRVLESYWIVLFPYSIIVWTTRISLSLSLARIFPWKHPARLWSFILAGIMALSCIACILISTLSCTERSSLIILSEPRQCALNISGFPFQNIYVFANDSFGDILLIISPLILFWRLKLPRQERRLILVVFCGSTLTLAYVIAFAIIALNPKISLGDDFLVLMAGLLQIEVAISLFVCNLAVVSTSLYQLVTRNRNQEWLESGWISTEPPSDSELQDDPQQCTCSLDKAPTPLTLTEISSSSSVLTGSTSDRSDYLQGTFGIISVAQSLRSESATVP
ncbi:hypothetical protein GALMADRAFT_145177 [Galerina marginata CBS 339.88]|uniref:Rhodopsin domain-containing protein n=1 Tax=Galerina marginata (strain CBS 339.88) TaxID=685588 RepID=A0A067SFU7_GALM3|nr:hypothetical protein GALMADRAFT_145177 [Galerina marginata CBS 339.88]